MNIKNCILFIILSVSGYCYAQEAPEKPMVIIIPSYNNTKWYKANLKSVLLQDYSNYRVIYVDDCSTDGMSALVQEFIKNNDKNHRVTYIKNSENHGCLYNVYHAVMSCDDNDIIVKVDGDDWLPHNQVLRKINDVYQNENVWLTHGSLILYPDHGNGSYHAYDKDIIEQAAYRYVDWQVAHLHTFYAWLFKNIQVQDLMYDGNFLAVTEDQARMYPMLEMADGRIAFMSDSLYVYNTTNMISDWRVKTALQRKCEFKIRSWKRYARLEHAGIRDEKALIYR